MISSTYHTYTSSPTFCHGGKSLGLFAWPRRNTYSLGRPLIFVLQSPGKRPYLQRLSGHDDISVIIPPAAKYPVAYPPRATVSPWTNQCLRITRIGRGSRVCFALRSAIPRRITISIGRTRANRAELQPQARKLGGRHAFSVA